VVAFDFRSHGRSDPGYDFSAEALAGDVEAVADALGFQQFVLVGHSMGGAASIAFAGAHPDRVAGLVLVATPGKSSPEQSKPVVDSLKTDAYDQVMQGYMKQLLEHAKPEVNTQVTNEFRKLDKSTSIGVISRLFEFDPIPILKSYKGPLLIVATTREKQQPNALMHQLPKVPARVIDGTSHWIQLDKPDEFNLTLDDFLKQIK
jgi:pimeloyl-ACP methyl ester carboxylesterase